MRHRTPLCVERIEPRCLMSGLAYSLTTDQPSYQVGQPIQFTFTETNTGSTPVQLGVGPVNSGFDVVQNGVTVWASNTGPQPQYILVEFLQPGQSETLTATWDGIPNLVPPTVLTGSFTVTNQQAPTSASATFQIQPQPGGAVVTSVTTDKSVYLVGQPVQMTFAETNKGSVPVQVLAGSGTFTVSQNGNPVWVSGQGSAVTDQSFSWQTLAPGQALTQTATWNGIAPNEPSGPVEGTLTLTDDLAPSVSTTFQIVSAITSPMQIPLQNDPALSATLTTNKSAYRLGQPVSMTLTLTNKSDASVTITPNPSFDGFYASRANLLVWRHLATAVPDASLSIAPGQTVTFTTTWNGRPNQRGARGLHAGTYTLVADEGDYQVSTTIRIGKPIPASRTK
ncbi:MAG: hypothetical protein ACLQVF_32475 [Isosphaeraceae bacterium]